MKPALLIISLVILFLFESCTSTNQLYYDTPLELTHPLKKKDFITEYSHYLLNKKIFIDPGHGGEDRKNIGYLGLAVEADINLRVAVELRNLLIEAGAIVEMSRTKDETVPLKTRSELANKSGSDIFVSIHHNAPAMDGDNYTNYTSTYYHSTKEDFNFEPCEQDLAKYIQRDLAYAMRNSGGPGSFDGTYSDYSIYPGEGFSVLRLTSIPAVLVECGFHTHHIQEQKLVDEFYNKIEAWGIFKGLCRYFKSEIPQITFNKKTKIDSVTNIQFALTDSSGIDAGSIEVYIDSIETYFNYSETSGLLTVETLTEKPEIEIRIVAANKNGNHSFPFRKKIILTE